MRRTQIECAGSRSIWVAFFVIGVSSPLVWGVTATFEARIAQTESDAILDLTNPADVDLDLDLFVTLTNGPPPEDILGVSVFLQPTADGVVTFQGGSFLNVFSGDPAHEQGVDNSPVSGAFSRGVGFLPATALAIGETRLATFSVSAVGPGVIQYQFLDSWPVRPWSMDFYDFSTATLVAGTPLTITVVPEPGVAATLSLVLCWSVLSVRRRAPSFNSFSFRRRGRAYGSQWVPARHTATAR